MPESPGWPSLSCGVESAFAMGLDRFGKFLQRFLTDQVAPEPGAIIYRDATAILLLAASLAHWLIVDPTAKMSIAPPPPFPSIPPKPLPPGEPWKPDGSGRL